MIREETRGQEGKGLLWAIFHVLSDSFEIVSLVFLNSAVMFCISLMLMSIWNTGDAKRHFILITQICFNASFLLGEIKWKNDHRGKKKRKEEKAIVCEKRGLQLEFSPKRMKGINAGIDPTDCRASLCDMMWISPSNLSHSLTGRPKVTAGHSSPQLHWPSTSSQIGRTETWLGM